MLDHKPPPSPPPENIEMQDATSDGLAMKQIDLDRINDEVVEALRESLRHHLFPPHRVPEALLLEGSGTMPARQGTGDGTPAPDIFLPYNESKTALPGLSCVHPEGCHIPIALKYLIRL
ncbi:mucin [Colletotrichum higginsianum]|uniref:Mucin n=1 Tax=Colletotrichum higginsianum (strain IMI 349063) TaxID=759273 RepID=H1W2K8_COLHI|nr:mucin [Colletotrichum higginsianum]